MTCHGVAEYFQVLRAFSLPVVLNNDSVPFNVAEFLYRHSLRICKGTVVSTQGLPRSLTRSPDIKPHIHYKEGLSYWEGISSFAGSAHGHPGRICPR